MSIGSLDALSAYGRAAGVSPLSRGPGIGGPGSADAPVSGGFGQLVQDMVGEASGSLKAAETASARQIAGKGDLIDVVTAMGAAEVALDTVVAVRDRVVNAYSEIMRMQI
ncbi:flagellar hook-basal body complex protein FliE [Sphingomonas suaedae]|uniref:Flagellar hook-basal body complex protein FliE n=1 Tax=Sphingomonas suaedae TaxID=2599297 RepID=A0A518REC9_9SPHN|nr:flagellar hook-basal body complex protein FliE [Sphingomonas suaedae]QDX25789.1 flagellar hook-basal body complex protein FliE [Sphingomonas suaedae]